MVVNEEGIPLLGHASDGNESDRVWNRRVIKELVAQFTDHLTDHLTDLVYVNRRSAQNLIRVILSVFA